MVPGFALVPLAVTPTRLRSPPRVVGRPYQLRCQLQQRLHGQYAVTSIDVFKLAGGMSGGVVAQPAHSAMPMTSATHHAAADRIWGKSTENTFLLSIVYRSTLSL